MSHGGGDGGGKLCGRTVSTVMCWAPPDEGIQLGCCQGVWVPGYHLLFCCQVSHKKEPERVGNVLLLN